MDVSELSVLSASPSCIGGGAERVALMLHQQYLARGIDSWLAVANRNCDEARTLEIPLDAERSAWARALIPSARVLGERRGGAARLASRALRALAEPSRYARVLRGHEDFDFPSSAELLDVAPSRPDVLHLHNLHGAWFDVKALPLLSSQVPTIITLHDAWLLTGHCAYPLDCTRWQGGCGECPALDLYVPIRHDASASNAAIKRQSVQASRLALACPSQWLLSMVRTSGIATASTDARVIPNGIDTSVFRPAERTRVRGELGLPKDATILSFAARGLEGSPYKGFDTLRSALHMLAEQTLDSDATLLLALGSVTRSTRVGNIEIRSIPFMENPADVARIYQASDLYVHPARAESFGLAVAEAMACETPVVAAAVGGIPEIIEDGKSGVLFPGDDARALADAVRDLLADDVRRSRIGSQGAQRIRDRFTLETQVDAYLAWYREIIEEWGA